MLPLSIPVKEKAGLRAVFLRRLERIKIMEAILRRALNA